ncbi:MAG TPA: hypothetical protein VKX33_01715 [Cyclobacteriaceae bacterium]|nr:hypothetical protein [Cyclobacteriaceae bacterium]
MWRLKTSRVMSASQPNSKQLPSLRGSSPQQSMSTRTETSNVLKLGLSSVFGHRSSTSHATANTPEESPYK